MTTPNSLIASKYPEMCRISEQDNVLEFYLDNQTLSSLRSCEGFFKESFINNLQLKTQAGEINYANTNLDIGIWFHKVMERVDKEKMLGKELSTNEAILFAQSLWAELGLEQYKTTNAYKVIGGMLGACQLVKDYMEFFNPAQSNGFNKIIATELVFGYAKEAPLVEWGQSQYEYRAYLVGRPDSLVETPLGIGPKDFKTTSRMDQVRSMYKPSEQLIGYVYGVNKIFQNSLEHLGQRCNTAYLIAVNKRTCENPKDRVAQIIYTYSDADLEAYRKRQVASIDRLYELIVLGKQETWDTSKCSNWFFNLCPFHKLHSGDYSQREALLEAFYSVKKPWNPRTRI